MKARHAMRFGAEVGAGGVRFAVWAPGARYANLHLGETTLPMESHVGGFFVNTVAAARAGARYGYSFDHSRLRVPDPASRYNPEDVHAPSEVVDPEAYEWTDDHWRGRPFAGAVIYELHVGTFTAAGTFAAAAQRLGYLSELGVTAIELMPVADTPGRCNWGYDGVLPFAPEHAYGRPEDLKRFVESAHGHGLMVLLDVVYNHFGPDGNYLHLYAPQFFTARHKTPWGNAINFDDAYSGVVRRFFIDNALYWLSEYRFDGLRLDAVHAIADDSDPDFLTELATSVAAAVPERMVHLILENDANAARYLARGADGRPRHYTAQWNDDFHHALLVLLTGDVHGHYRDYDRPAEQLLRCLLEGFAYQGEHSRYRKRPRGERSHDLPPDAFVNFLQNHDQIGNRPDGKRLWMLLDGPRITAAETLLLLLPAPILLFMGDEFHAPNRFPFFCDFTGELGSAIREGRRKDFAALFDMRDALPDPNDPCERQAAVLDWEALAQPPHRAAYERYARLLGVRRTRLQPLLPAARAAGALHGDRLLTATWPLAGGARLQLVANLAPRSAAAPARPAGVLLAATHEAASAHAAWPPWLVGWFLET